MNYIITLMALLIATNVQAEKLSVKLLVNAPTGMQEIVEIHPSGSYFESSRVVWDERKDGLLEIDEKRVGGYIRVDEKLVFSGVAKAAYDKLIKAKEDKEKEIKDKHDRMGVLKGKTELTGDELSEAVKLLLQKE